MQVSPAERGIEACCEATASMFIAIGLSHFEKSILLLRKSNLTPLPAERKGTGIKWIFFFNNVGLILDSLVGLRWAVKTYSLCTDCW